MSRVTYAALCVLANACSLEVPSTGAIDGIFDASSALPEGVGSTGEPGPKEPTDDPQIAAPKEAGPQPAPDPHDAGTLMPIVDAASAQEPGCQLDGRFALRVAFDVAWVGTQFASIVPIIDNGEGELSFTVLMELKSKRDELQAKFRTCSSEVPEFVATLSRERYQARFAESVWDATSMPTFSTSLRTSCREPGCRLGGEPLYSLIGADLPSATEPWPLDVSAGTWPDHDGDGEPGVAVTMLGPEQGPYAYPPLDLLSLRRVRSLGLGLRVIVGLDGTLDSCDALHGPTKEGSVETRAVSCQAQAASATCQPQELAFLNENLPVWTVRQGSFQAKRVASDADCQTVRRLFARHATP